MEKKKQNQKDNAEWKAGCRCKRTPSSSSDYKLTLGLPGQLMAHPSPDPAGTLFPPEYPLVIYNPVCLFFLSKATKLELYSA